MVDETHYLRLRGGKFHQFNCLNAGLKKKGLYEGKPAADYQ